MTHLGEKSAIQLLSRFNWKIDVASDNYFSNQNVYQQQQPPSNHHHHHRHHHQQQQSVVNSAKLEELFNQLKGKQTPLKHTFSLYTESLALISSLQILRIQKQLELMELQSSVKSYRLIQRALPFWLFVGSLELKPNVSSHIKNS